MTVKKDKKTIDQMIKKTNIISSFKEIAHDIFLEEDSLLLKLEQLKIDPTHHEIDEVELIHDLRVNLRRLISLLYFYGPLLKKEERKAMIKDLNLLLKSFGTQRTQDILRKSVLKYSTTKKDKEGLEVEIEKTILNLLAEAIEKAQFEKNKTEKLTPNDPKFKSIYESVYSKLMDSEVNLFRSKKSAKIENPHIFKKERIQELMKTFKKMEEEVDLSKVKEIHRLRILGKNIFYTVNFFNEEFEGAYKVFLVHLQKIQDVAGKIHDADVNLSILKDLITEKEKNNIAQDFMAYLEGEKEEKILEFKKIIEEKIS